MPESVPLTELASGIKVVIRLMNSLVMKNNAKYKMNFTSSERKTHAKTVLKTDRTMPNMVCPSS
jgi:hypothetical protein